MNGEAIYGTHNWIQFSEGGGRGQPGLNIRFTVKGETLYAIILGNWPGKEAVIRSLAKAGEAEGKIPTVSMLGRDGDLQFNRAADGLTVKLPASAPCKYAYTLKITGLKMNPPTWTVSGNPE